MPCPRARRVSTAGREGRATTTTTTTLREQAGGAAAATTEVSAAAAATAAEGVGATRSSLQRGSGRTWKR